MPRRSLLSPEKRARLESIAALKASLPSSRQLAIELGVTTLYVRQLLSRMIRVHRNKVTSVTFHVEPDSAKMPR